MIQYKLITVEQVTTKYYRIPSELCDSISESDLYQYAEDGDKIERWLSDEDYMPRVLSIVTIEEDPEYFTDAYANPLPLWHEESEAEHLTKFYEQMEEANSD